MADNNDNTAYKRFLESSKETAEREYAQIAAIVEEYQFKDAGVRKEAQKLLEVNRKHHDYLSNELKALESGDSNSTSKRRTRKGTVANRVVGELLREAGEMKKKKMTRR